MTTTDGPRVTRIVPASRERVFDAWLDPKALASFIRPAPGVTVPKAEVDAREGGEFLLLMKVGERELPHRGTYQILDRPSRLVFTWVSENAGTNSLVTLDFEEAGEGKTRLTLVHTGLPSEKSKADHEKGWTSILDTQAEQMWAG